VFDEHFKELEGLYGEDAMRMLLLETTAATYPLLTRFQAAIHAPLAVIVDGEYQQVARNLKGFVVSGIVSLNEPPKEIKRQIAHLEYGLAVFTFVKGRYTRENLETLCSLCSRMNEDIGKQVLMIVLAAGDVPKEFVNDFAGFVYVKGASCSGNKSSGDCQRFFRELITFVLENMKEVRYELRNLPQQQEDGLRVICAAAAILRIVLKYEDISDGERGEYLDRLGWVKDVIMNEWQDDDDPEAYVSVFCRLLNKAIDWLPPVEECSKISDKTIEDPDDVVLYDDKFYYIPRTLFEEICSPLLNQASLNHIKRKLSDAGVLISKGTDRNYRTKQIELVGGHGRKIKKRFVKLSRNQIDRTGELTFWEKLKAREEEEYEECKTGEGSGNRKLLED